MKATFIQAQIKGIHTIVPPTKIDIDSELHTIYNGDESALKHIKKVIGLQTRHIATENTTAADLGERAANRLIESLGIDRMSIDALIFVMQNPDYILPARACYLQNRLGLSGSCLSFDINQACAGYLYGLYIAHSLIESEAAHRVLLLVGDTLSRFIKPLDFNLASSIGDGVSATLLESCVHFSNSHTHFNLGYREREEFLQGYRGDISPLAQHDKRVKHRNSSTQNTDSAQGFISGFGHNEIMDSILGIPIQEDTPPYSQSSLQNLPPSFFELGSDSTRCHQLILPDGASRIPAGDIIADSKACETSSPNELYTDEAEAFRFAVMQYSNTLNAIMKYAGCETKSIDYFFFHQANQYIVDNITKQLRLNKAKVPNTTIKKYGNLSGASIPATICDTLSEIAANGLEKALRIHLAGFGAGLAWGNAIVTLPRGFVCQRVEVYEKSK